MFQNIISIEKYKISIFGRFFRILGHFASEGQSSIPEENYSTPSRRRGDLRLCVHVLRRAGDRESRAATRRHASTSHTRCRIVTPRPRGRYTCESKRGIMRDRGEERCDGSAPAGYGIQHTSAAQRCRAARPITPCTGAGRKVNSTSRSVTLRHSLHGAVVSAFD